MSMFRIFAAVNRFRYQLAVAALMFSRSPSSCLVLPGWLKSSMSAVFSRSRDKTARTSRSVSV